jgi:hypothetical protein
MEKQGTGIRELGAGREQGGRLIAVFGTRLEVPGVLK